MVTLFDPTAVTVPLFERLDPQFDPLAGGPDVEPELPVLEFAPGVVDVLPVDVLPVVVLLDAGVDEDGLAAAAVSVPPR